MTLPWKITGAGANKEKAYINAVKKFWSSKQSFIFPIHWAENHWVVVRGDRAQRTWEIYNSIPSDSVREATEVQFHLRFILSKANTHAEIAKFPVKS